MELAVIARIQTDFPHKFGLPRQSGLVPELKGVIRFEPPYRSPDAVRGLGEFSHIWLLWGFSDGFASDRGSGTRAFSPTVRPPRLGGNERIGVWATRSPNRPNPIALSAVRLDRIEVEGKSDAMTDAFYQTSRKLVMATNLMTFNLRTIVLFICLLLRVEPIVCAFCLLVLEPLRIYLLRRYERLAARLLAETPATEAEREAAYV